MPLKAHINGIPKISVDMADYEWEELKQNLRARRLSVDLLCCDSPVYLRKSKLGTKHFVHKAKKGCDWKPETFDHLKIKELIYKFCKVEGWKAEPEYSFDDCIADVFATDGKTKVAFEIQLSPQTEKETVCRHEKYKDNGIKCVWFFKKIPRSLNSNANLPAFKLVTENDVYLIQINGRNLKLGTAIEKLLRREIRFRKKYTYKKSQVAEIYKFDLECWKCGKQTPVIAVHSYYVFCCGDSGYNMDLHDEDVGREIAKLQKQGLKELEDTGPVEKRFSKACGYSYWSNGCKWCGALIGKHFLHDEFLCNFPYKPEPILKVPFKLDTIGFNENCCPHWCIGGDEGFC